MQNRLYLIIILLPMLLFFGCTSTQDTAATDQVLGAGMPSQASDAESVRGALPATATDVIIDGPWMNLPVETGIGLIVDADQMSLTLDTDPLNIVFVIRPDDERDAFTNSIYSLVTFRDRIFLGYGDMTNNQGPVDLVSYDPVEDKLFKEMEDVPEEMVGEWFIGKDGTLYVAGMDAREPWAFGNFYSTNGTLWQKNRTIYRGVHVLGIVEYNDRLYAQFTSDGNKVFDKPFILVSDNKGLSWEYEVLEQETVKDTVVKNYAIIKEGEATVLYALVDVYKVGAVWGETRVYKYDNDTWTRIRWDDLGAEARPLDIYSYKDTLLIQFNQFDPQTENWITPTYAWKGEDREEVEYLRGRYFSFKRFCVHDDWLYALLPPSGSGWQQPPFILSRTMDLVSWEEMGEIAVPGGATVYAMSFFHGRMYFGLRNSWREITAEPLVYTFLDTRSEALVNASLTWDADVPSGSSLSFQIKAAVLEDDYEVYRNAAWLGPDGTSESRYSTPGQALPIAQQGSTIFSLSMTKSPNNSGQWPVVRSAVIQSQQGNYNFAIDTGSGLYTTANLVQQAVLTSSVFPLDAPIAGGRLFFEVKIPEGTYVRFQLRSANDLAALENTEFCGPDGSAATFYEQSGAKIWEGSSGHSFIQYRAVLGSDRPEVAPFLQQVIIITRDGVLGDMDIQLNGSEPFTAGDLVQVTISAKASDGSLLPLNGKLSLVHKLNDQPEKFVEGTQWINFTNGEATQDISLEKIGTGKVCVVLEMQEFCSADVIVRSAQAERLLLEATGLRLTGSYVSPHANQGQLISFDISAVDRFSNIVQDYSGVVQCSVWKWKMLEAPSIPLTTFNLEDQGKHRLTSAFTINDPGEYSIVCVDSTNSSIGGSMAITVGEFNHDLFP